MSRFLERLVFCSASTVAVIAGLIGGVRPAQAQAADHQAAAGEIIVTARKRSESLQDVPESITAFGAADIAEARIETIDNALKLTPGVSIIRDQQPGLSTILIRGVGQNRAAEPPVAFVVDGVPLANPYEFTQDLFGIERIEVLRGPQGSLYGRNAIGGAINITTKVPTNELELEANLRYAEGNSYKVGLGAAGALAKDILLFRVSGTLKGSDGLIRNVTLDRKVDDFDENNLRGKLLFRPSDDFSIEVNGFHNSYRGGGGWWAPADVNALNLNSFTHVPQGDILGRVDREYDSASLKVEYDLGAVSLTSITGWAYLSESLDQDGDMSPKAVVRAKVGEKFETLTQEVRLASDGEAGLDWIVGAFYQNTQRKRRTEVSFNLNAPPPFGGGTGDPASANFIPVADIPSSRRYEAYAIFGQADLAITDQLKFTAGLRYDTEDRTQTLPVALSKIGFDSWQPKFSLAYNPAEAVMIYGTVAKGYRPGGFNDALTFGQTYKSETLWSYEGGLKSKMAGGNLILNLSIYRQMFSDPQFFLVDASGQQSIINGRKSRSHGAEIELQAYPVAGLQIFAGIGLIDTKITAFDAFPLFASHDTTQFVGNKSPQIPNYNINFTAQYSFALSSTFDLIARIDYRREGRVYWHLDNGDRRGGYDLFNAGLTLKRDNLSVSLFADNLFDKKYVNSFLGSDWTGLPNDIVWTPPPRVLGIEARLGF